MLAKELRGAKIAAATSAAADAAAAAAKATARRAGKKPSSPAPAPALRLPESLMEDDSRSEADGEAIADAAADAAAGSQAPLPLQTGRSRREEKRASQATATPVVAAPPPLALPPSLAAAAVRSFKDVAMAPAAAPTSQQKAAGAAWGIHQGAGPQPAPADPQPLPPFLQSPYKQQQRQALGVHVGSGRGESLNNEQRRVVEDILAGNGSHRPYILVRRAPSLS